MDVFSHVGTFSTSDIYNDFGQSAYRSAEDNRATESFVDSMEGAVGIIEAEWGSDSTPSHSWQTDEDMKAGSYHTMFCLKSSSMYIFLTILTINLCQGSLLKFQNEQRLFIAWKALCLWTDDNRPIAL
jgi:hypothetical protein